MAWRFLVLLLTGWIPALVRGTPIDYTGDVFPEEIGWERVGTFDADRWLDNGWLYQHVQLGDWAPPPGGEQDFYQRALADFAGERFFIEWRVVTDAPATEIDGVGGSSLSASGGGILYHLTIASDRVRLIRGVQYPVVWVDSQPDTAHTYRLEVDGAADFRWFIDTQLITSGVPEGEFPNPAAFLTWGAKYHLSESTNSWDYVMFGAIPEPGTGVLLLGGAGLLLVRTRSPRSRTNHRPIPRCPPRAQN